ncbi:MAG: hypothetical protein HQL46_00960 [Gammaproteobacteria bacterium]|nr:hypothetical protein [Gammaproteobacteria bacterium]
MRLIIIIIISTVLVSCTTVKSLVQQRLSSKYGIGISQERWLGVIIFKENNTHVRVILDLNKYFDKVEGIFYTENISTKLLMKDYFSGTYVNKLLSIEGNVAYDPKVTGDAGIVKFNIIGNASDEFIDAKYTLTAQNSAETKTVPLLLYHISSVSYQLGVPHRHITEYGKKFLTENTIKEDSIYPSIQINKQSSYISSNNANNAHTSSSGLLGNGLLGPTNSNAYGIGRHSDATGRPFTWRTNDGQRAFGNVKKNAYGLGTGMDQFGRPVQASPGW